MTSPISLRDVSPIQIQGLTLEEAMMKVQLDRADGLEVQLKDYVQRVSDGNGEIAGMNKLLTDLRSLSHSGDDADQRANLGSSQQAGRDLCQRIKDAGLTMPTGVDEVSEAGTGIYSAKKKTFDVWAEELKGKIDAKANSQQMDMLRLQGMSNKRNEAFDTMTNLMKKFAEGRAAILANFR